MGKDAVPFQQDGERFQNLYSPNISTSNEMDDRGNNIQDVPMPSHDSFLHFLYSQYLPKEY